MEKALTFDFFSVAFTPEAHSEKFFFMMYSSMFCQIISPSCSIGEITVMLSVILHSTHF